MKNIWIWNHYATNTFYDRGGRHYWFAKNLIKRGYKPTVFCASTVHNSDKIIDTGHNKYTTDSVDGIPYVFVKTTPYKGNGLSRIKNMISFYINIFKVAKEYVEINGKPDVILASSVHPLTLVAGIKIAKKFKVPCICEVRDLWPESFVAYGVISDSNPILNLLYMGEKWIYEKTDKLIFTMEGGRDYIVEKKWDMAQGGPINLKKVIHINNGVDLIEYDENMKNKVFEDADLDNENIFKVIYVGSIRKVNDVGKIIDTAKKIKDYYNDKKIQFLIFGDGDEKEYLQKKCVDERIDNVIFKGKVEKAYIPNILSKSNLNILHSSETGIMKYGASQNKSFEYLASGKPIINTTITAYDIIERYNAGISIKNQTSEEISKAIISIYEMNDEDYNIMANNARQAAYDYDFGVLTDKLISIIENDVL